MDSLNIEIKNPKVLSILKNLADLNLIRINEKNEENKFAEILTRFRSKSEQAPSLEEISKEVESVRKANFEK